MKIYFIYTLILKYGDFEENLNDFVSIGFVHLLSLIQQNQAKNFKFKKGKNYMQFNGYAFIFELIKDKNYNTNNYIILKGENIVIRIIHIIFTQMMDNFFAISECEMFLLIWNYCTMEFMCTNS